MATIGNYRRHVMELRDIIKTNGENTKDLIKQSNKFDMVLAVLNFRDNHQEDFKNLEIITMIDKIKKDLLGIVEKSVKQHIKLFEAYDRLIDDLLKE
jgi:Mg2+ and Co2+ transporter CorA